MAQWGAWYPSYFLNCLFPMPWSVNFFQILHMFWGGCGMYGLARRLGLGTFAAAFAGFAYVFNGVTPYCLMWISYTAFLAWSPWVLGSAQAAWREGGRWIPVAALAAAMQVLAGAPELTVLFWTLVGLLWLRDVFGARRATGETSSASPLPCPDLSRDSWNSSLRVWPALGRLSLAVLLAAGITMVQMLPFFDLLIHSQRNLNYGSNAWAMPSWGLANLLVPLFHSSPDSGGPWFQAGQGLVCSYYLGVAVLVLAIAGAWLSDRMGLIFGGMSVFCWLVAMGSNGFLFGLAKGIVPWLGVARYPVKSALFPVLLLPLLAAWAIEATSQKSGARTRRLTTFLAGLTALATAVLVWLARLYPMAEDQWAVTAQNALWRVVALAAILAIVMALHQVKRGAVRLVLQITVLLVLACDGFTHNPRMSPSIPASNLAAGMWTTVGKTTPSLGFGRVMSSPYAEMWLRTLGPPDPAVHLTSKRLAEADSLNLLDGVPKVGGMALLRLAYFDQLYTNLYSVPNSHFGQGMLDFLSVAWYSSPTNPVLVASRTNHLPVVSSGQRPLFVSDVDALRATTANGFSPSEVVYLPENARSLVTVTNKTVCRLIAVKFEPRRIQAEVEATEPSLVVLSQCFHHLWRASVDENEPPLLRANLGFQALEVPAGRHHVALVYRDVYFRMGAVISVISLVVCLVFWLQARNSRLSTSSRDILSAT